MKLPLAVTMGEPAGIGGEIALKAWLGRDDGVPPFYVIDDPDRLAALAADLDWAVPIRAITATSETGVTFPVALPVVPVRATVRARAGHPDPANAPAVVAAIDAAVDDVRSGDAAAMVTNPIHKDSLYRAGFRHPGHTEYLAELAGGGCTPIMMLVCPELRVVPVTIHLPLRRVADALNATAIVTAGRIVHAALRRDFGIVAPVLAVAGLNPHAGEAGGLGHEEIDIIAPAVAALRAEGVDARGPFSADTMFHVEARRSYDAALCMYHDQALIPIKTIDFDGGVNVTLGLPFVRTSPDHGTAFAIAGTGKARPASLIAALRLAARMAATRLARARPRREPDAGARGGRGAVAAAARCHRPARPGRPPRAGPAFPARRQPDRRASPAPPGDWPGAQVIEVGPGPGGLTRALLDTDGGPSSRSSAIPRAVAAMHELAQPARAGSTWWRPMR